jgi:hypothetical protein
MSYMMSWIDLSKCVKCFIGIVGQKGLKIEFLAKKNILGLNFQ